MKATLSLFAVLFCSLQFTFAQYNLDNLHVETAPTAVQQLTFENLRIYPIKANDVFRLAHSAIGNFSNLQNALEADKVVITELEEGEEVNTLYVENVSQDSVFIMAGEVVQGGKQDRVLAQDIILTPGQKVDISVFCVEQGRWDYEDSDSFGNYYNLAENGLRKIVVKGKDQQEVWDKVDDVTELNQAQSETSAYTKLEDAKEYQESLNPYLQKLSTALENQNEVIGVVAVTGNKVIGCDMFATHDLFKNAYNSLLNAYAAEAISTGAPVTISDQVVRDYVAKILGDERKQDQEVEKNGSIYHRNGKKVHITVFDL